MQVSQFLFHVPQFWKEEWEVNVFFFLGLRQTCSQFCKLGHCGGFGIFNHHDLALSPYGKKALVSGYEPKPKMSLVKKPHEEDVPEGLSRPQPPDQSPHSFLIWRPHLPWDTKKSLPSESGDTINVCSYSTDSVLWAGSFYPLNNHYLHLTRTKLRHGVVEFLSRITQQASGTTKGANTCYRGWWHPNP